MDALGPGADRTIEEVLQALSEQGLAFSFGSLQRFFKRHAITRKKDRPHGGAGAPRCREAAAGLARRPVRPDPERLVFIDETWASTNMARRHGRSPRGERLGVGAPHGPLEDTHFH